MFYLLATTGIEDYISHVGWASLIDLAVIIALSVVIFVFFKKKNALNLAIFYALFILAYIAVLFIGAIVGNGFLYITGQIFHYLTIFLIFATVLVYQSDLKVVFSRIGRGLNVEDGDIESTDDDIQRSATEIVKACQNMAKNDVGALIVIVRSTIPPHILDTGTSLNASISSGLLESIFNTKAPLHDGAVIIKGTRILSAGCFLPLSQELSLAKDLGTRHRAAIGITEESDVFTIVVSEESGIISTVENGKIVRYMTPERLFEQIKVAYGISSKPKKDRKKDKRFL